MPQKPGKLAWSPGVVCNLLVRGVGELLEASKHKPNGRAVFMLASILKINCVVNTEVHNNKKCPGMQYAVIQYVPP